MGTREDLDLLLRQTIHSNNVYFQPPVNLTISYPCIVYSLDVPFSVHADNTRYHRRKRYELIFITRDPDSELVDQIADLPYCAMGRPYTSDNLHHYPYTIYY